jgi:hypothetical protein
MDWSQYLEKHWMGMGALLVLIGLFLWVNFIAKIR